MLKRSCQHAGRVVALLLVVGLTVAVVRSAEPASSIVFTDVTQRSGVTFVHHNGAAGGNLWYPEIFGGGVAVLDIDGDAWPDLLFVDGKDWQPAGRRPRHGLFRNN